MTTQQVRRVRERRVLGVISLNANLRKQRAHPVGWR
jgi:hypothetical protein